ncbi:MAG: hypothetical protein EAY69_08080 [Cytophagales bacterium]|nr:MAG: hypothetical protein EAY69_08080 [Cytophagales bacterium]
MSYMPYCSNKLINIMQFEFVSEKAFQIILERDYEEVQKYLETKSSKSVLVLSGSIVEALLTDYFIENLPDGQTKASILSANLAKLLDFAETQEIITKSEKNLATVIKDFRNLIHPGLEVRKHEQFDFETAQLASQILNLLIRKIQRKYREKFAFTCEDILKNLNEDWNYNFIYSIAITKISNGEKNNLIDAFIEIENKIKSKFIHYKGKFEYAEKYPEIYDIKHYVSELKPILKEETIKLCLKKLVISVTSGHSLNSLSLYNLFHEYLHLLTEDEQLIVSTYMFSLLGNILENYTQLAADKTYSTIGKYAKGSKGKELIKNFCIFAIPHFGGRAIDYEIDLLEQILNSFSEEVKIDTLAKLKEELLPLDKVPRRIIDDFVTPMIKRGLLNFN